MSLTDAQTVAYLSNTYTSVTNLWVYYNYEGCPRDIIPKSLEKQERDIRSYIAIFDKHSEFKMVLPSVSTLQHALQETVIQTSLARNTFSWPSFLEQRKEFYKLHGKIFNSLSLARIQFAASRISSFFLPKSPANGTWTSTTPIQLQERLNEVREIFLYKLSPLSITQEALLSFEKEFRGILESIEKSPQLKQSTPLVDPLRQTVLRLNYAADTLDLSSPEERSKQFHKAFRIVQKNLSQTVETFQLKN